MPDITITLSDEDIHLWAKYQPPAYATVLDRAERAMADACRQWVEDNKPIPEEPPIGTVMKGKAGMLWKRHGAYWGRPWSTNGLSYRWADLNEFRGPLTIVEPDAGRPTFDLGDPDVVVEPGPPQRTEYRMYTWSEDGHSTGEVNRMIQAADLRPGDRLAGGVVENVTRVESDGYICAYAGSTTLWSGWPNTLIVLEES